ncbi:hypothetical protein MRX96_040550 [Rhipicephalus microplus]
MNFALEKVFSVRALRQRLDLLMAQFLENDRASLKRRRKAQAVTASADYEFIEKRWRHERALKEKEHALKMERLAVEKLRIERKQERSEKRHKLKRDRTERELKLREREMKIRECQLQAQLDEASRREQLSRFHKATQHAILKIVETI